MAVWAVLFASCFRADANWPTNLVVNPGFEFGESKLPWEPFSNNCYWVMMSPSIAHTGSNYLEIIPAIEGYSNTTGLYEDILSGPGTAYAADGWMCVPSTNMLKGQNAAWIEVSFRDASMNILALYRSCIITTNTLARQTTPPGCRA